MSGVAHGYTLVLGDETGHGAAISGYMVADCGVLFASGDRGATWRWYGLVDPELFLLDLGFEEAWELAPGGAAPLPWPAPRSLPA
jgi:hypothetical protein